MKTLTIFAVLMLTCLASATIIHVPADQSTIQAGIDAAANGDTVLVAEGTYVENINYNGKTITVASHYAIDQDSLHIVNTVIDGSSATNPDSASTVSFVSGEDTTSVLMGLTITGGSGTLWEGPREPVQLGGGIVCIESGAKIIHNIIRDNTVHPPDRLAEGAAIGAERGDSQAIVLVEKNVIVNNHCEATDKMAESAGVALYATGRIVGNVIKNNTLLSGPVGGPVAIGAGVTADFILIKDNLIIENESIVSNGDLNAAAVVVASTETEICDNTISHNKISSLFGTYGTGLYLIAADNAIVRNNIITHNSYNHAHTFSRGCFVYLGEDILIEHNTISDNDSTGGIYIHSASATIQHNTIQRNVQYGMAGIGGYKSTVLIQNNVISHNNALDRGAGGGIGFIDAESALIQNNLVFKNHGRRGGGIGAWPSTPETQNSHAINTENYPARRADLFNLRTTSQSSSIPDLGAVVLMNNTVCDNSAFQDGGGLYSRDWPMYVINTIVWGNRGNDHPSIWDKNNSALVVYNSDIQGGWSGMAFDVMDEDPQLVGPLYHLSSGSPCIGMGLSEVDILGQTVNVPSVDFGGRARPNPAGSSPDLGAWEHRLGDPMLSRILHVPADFATIQRAIDASTDGDTVLVAEGMYTENINFKGKAITVASHYIMDQDTSHISKTIIDGSGATNPDSASTVLFVSGEDTTSVLTGLAITGGGGTIWRAPDGSKVLVGGGIFCHKSGAKIVKNIIKDNTIESDKLAIEGGGIDLEPGDKDAFVVVQDNIIENNHVKSTAGWAAAAGLGIYSGCLVKGNIIRGNSATGTPAAGGALILGQDDDLKLIDNLVENNKSLSETGDLAYAVVLIFNGKALLKDNKIVNNQVASNNVPYGTGIFVNAATSGTMIRNNIISGNKYNRQSLLSKALFLFKSNDVLVENNTMANNVNTGGIHLDQTTAIIRGNSITDNVAFYATGISGVVSKAVIENNTVARNTGETGSGGGWLMSMQSALLQNNLFYENDAGSRAAGGLAVGLIENNLLAQISVQDLPIKFMINDEIKKADTAKSTIPDLQSVVLINNTIVNNKAYNFGGGLFIGKCETHCINNIIWGNTAGTDGAQIWDPFNMLNAMHCNVQGGWDPGANIIDADPLFQGENFELSNLSQCIGSGIASVNINGVEVKCPARDCHTGMRPNPAGSNPDIGAVESALPEPEGTRTIHDMSAIPANYALAQNYPNPFNPATTIEYQLPESGHVTVSIHNLAGQLVKILVDAEHDAGVYLRLWDATDNNGSKVSSGIYIYRIYVQKNLAGREAWQSERKMVFLK